MTAVPREPRDVWALRQEMERVDPDDVTSFSAAEVLARLDDCPPVASHDGLLRECRDVIREVAFAPADVDVDDLLRRVDAAPTEENQT